MLRCGTTTIEAKSGYGLDRETELRMLRVLARLDAEGPVRIVPTLLAAHTVPPEFAGRREEYVRWIAEELIPEVAAAGLARYCDAFCDDHAFTVDEARTVLTAARRHGLRLARARRAVPAGHRRSSGRRTGRGHRRSSGNRDHRNAPPCCAKPECSRCCCRARSSRWDATQYPPARTMIELGLGIVLATDFNPGSSPVASMPFILSLACLQMRLNPAEALTAATINAAWSLGLGHQVGSLEAGKHADFLIHEFDDYRELAYFIAAPLRPRVFIAGKEVTP